MDKKELQLTSAIIFVCFYYYQIGFIECTCGGSTMKEDHTQKSNEGTSSHQNLPATIDSIFESGQL